MVTLENLKNGALTADVDRAAEGLGDLGVELNHEVSLVRELVVALLDCLGDPLPERLPDHRVDHINDPLPWQLTHVTLVGQVRRDLFVRPCLLEDVLDREPGIERDVEVLGCLRFNDYREGQRKRRLLTAFLAPHQVLEEVDGHGLGRREVGQGVDGEELVHLVLGAELGTELGGGHLSICIDHHFTNYANILVAKLFITKG